MSHLPESVILVNMCMVKNTDGRVLVLDRLNPDWPGITFPGGHVEPHEPFVDAVIREVFEETGLHISHPTLCGTKQFQTTDGYRYVVFLYSAVTDYCEITCSDEGKCFWVTREELEHMQTAHEFLPLLQVFDGKYSEFFYERDLDGSYHYKLL